MNKTTLSPGSGCMVKATARILSPYFFFLFLSLMAGLVGCDKDEEDVLTLTHSDLMFGEAGGTETIKVEASSSWNVRLTDNEASSWLTLTNTTGKKGQGSFTLIVARNRSYDDRTGEITIQAGQAITTLQIKQSKKETFIIEGHKEFIASPAAATFTIPIKKNIDYQAVVSNDSRSWISIVDTKGLTAAELTVAIDENTSPNDREGSILFSTSNPELNDTIYIGQLGILFSISSPAIKTTAEANTKKLHVAVNLLPVNTALAGGEDWCRVTEDTRSEDEWGTLTLTYAIEFSENTTGQDRSTSLTIQYGSYSQTVPITQQAESPDEYYADKEYILLQQASVGDGVDLVVMGDGFAHHDLMEGGRYEQIMKQAMEYFFNIEPYTSLRQYFNVYMIAAESDGEGVNGEFPSVKVNNKFDSTYGEGTNITFNDLLCEQYVRSIPDLKRKKEIIAILVLNSYKYAGTTYMYSDGFAIAACPMSIKESPLDFEGLIHHEAGGHGFGMLADEYIYYDKQIPQADKNLVLQFHQAGFMQNIDFTKDLSRILWKNFIGIDKYNYVSAVEGAYMYSRGIWRPEKASCMDDNIPYYNAPSRWFIANRIMRLAGEKYTFEEFVKQDNVRPPVVQGTKSARKKVPPLGRPVLIIR